MGPWFGACLIAAALGSIAAFLAFAAWAERWAQEDRQAKGHGRLRVLEGEAGAISPTVLGTLALIGIFALVSAALGAFGLLCGALGGC
jgi:hypothetical protein